MVCYPKKKKKSQFHKDRFTGLVPCQSMGVHWPTILTKNLDPLFSPPPGTMWRALPPPRSSHESPVQT